MPAPTKQDRMVERLLTANIQMAEALTEAVKALAAQRPQEATGAILPPSQIRFEDLPQDDWDKPERLWKSEQEEDDELREANATGVASIDPTFLAEILEHAGMPNTTITTS